MCHFIKTVSYCGHVALLTTPSGTKLCESALRSNFRQGIDTAPPSCVALPDDIDNDAAIFGINIDLKVCDDCSVRYGLANANMKHYTDDDLRNLHLMQQQLDCYFTQAHKLSGFFEANAHLRSKISQVGSKWLEEIFDEEGIEKYKYLMFDYLEDASDWIGHLYTYIEQGAPVDMYRKAFQYTVEKGENAAEAVALFDGLLEALVQFDMETGFCSDRVSMLANNLQNHVDGPQYACERSNFPGPAAKTPPESRPNRAFNDETNSFSIPNNPTTDSEACDENTVTLPRENKLRPTLTVKVYQPTPGVLLPEVIHVPMSDRPRTPMSPSVWAEQYRMNARMMMAASKTPAPAYASPGTNTSCCFAGHH